MNWKKFLPHIAAVLIFIATTFVFFPQAYQGKVVSQPDMMSYKGIEKEAKDFKEKTGETTLWTNRAFGGMPTFIWAGGGATYTNNLLRPLHKYVMGLSLPQPSGLFFVAFIGFYILLISMGVNPWLSIVASLAWGFSSYNFLIYEAGHGSKFVAIAYFPLVAAGVLLAYRKKYLLGGAIFGLGFGLEMLSGHFQMTYYFGIAMAIYVLVKLIYSIKDGEIPAFAKASGVLLIAGLLAFGANASQMWSAYEYSKQSIRGPSILKSETGQDNPKGLDKDYTFQWSQGIVESFTFLVPGFYGGSSQQPIGENSAVYQDLKRKGVPRNQIKAAPLYWGKLPSTSGPIYFGAIVCFLFVFSLFVVKGELKWWLLAATILTIMLSWGKNFAGFNDLFYYYFPFYNKFRAVSSILTIPQFTMPFLGFLGLSALINNSVDRKWAKKALLISAGITGGICLLLALIGPNMLSFEGMNDARLKQAGYSLNALMEDRQSMMRNDAFRSFILVLLSAGLLFVYLNEKIKGNWKNWLLFGGLGVLTVFDLGGVGKRFLNTENFVSKKKYENQIWNLRAVDKQIQGDKDPNYRVFDMSVSPFNSNVPTRHHKNIGGYHPAKLRRYNDMVEKHIGRGNSNVLNMLNTKYIISQDQKPQQNPGALGNAWFVTNVKSVNTPNEEINSLENFDPKTTAFVHKEFDSYLNGFSGGNGQGSIQLTDYQPNKITYKTSGSSEQLAVFSEVWYDPGKGKGWQAFLDDQPVEHIRANYVLRAMKVPSGEHEIVFEFKPKFYYAGETVSLISSILLLLGGLAIFVLEFMKNNKRQLALEEEKASTHSTESYSKRVQQTTEEKTVQQTVKRTKDKRKGKDKTKGNDEA